MQIITTCSNNNVSISEVVEVTDHPLRPTINTTDGTYTVLRTNTQTGEMLVSLHRPYGLWGGRTWTKNIGGELIATRGWHCGSIGTVLN
jgi:hypothetical protein